LRYFSPILGTYKDLFQTFFLSYTIVYKKKEIVKRFFWLSHHNGILKNPFFSAVDCFRRQFFRRLDTFTDNKFIFRPDSSMQNSPASFRWGYGEIFQDNCY
jgi:hypothetical protein